MILVVDLETAGLDAATRGVCELGSAVVYYDDEDSWGVADVRSWLLNPGTPIDPGASAVNHLIEADLRDMRPWRDAMIGLPWAGKCLAAHRMEFDRQWLTEEITGPDVQWICTRKCAMRLWPDAPSFSNQALRYWLKLPHLDRALAKPAHRAGPDAYVTACLLVAMLGLTSQEVLIAWSAEPALLPRCMTGKHRGQPWDEVPSRFLEWMLQPGRDFDADTIFTVQQTLARRRHTT